MGIQTIKVLRTISKVILAIFILAFVGYGGLVTYKSIINRPRDVRITNITDSAATITWVTDNPVRGVVYYNEKGFFLSGPFSFIFGRVAYDDRDLSGAQDACVAEFNENAKNTKDQDFSVDGSGFDCEDARVKTKGAYYTHSVTIPNLSAETKYSFVVGNGIWSWKENRKTESADESLNIADIFNFKTFNILENVSTPNIAFGKVYAGAMSEEGYVSDTSSSDSYVVAFLTLDETDSNLVSATTNADGGWILDKSSFRDATGEVISDLGNAVMTVCVQYEDVNGIRCKEATGDLTEDTEIDLLGNYIDDLTPYEKSKLKELFDDLVNKVYAVDYEACPSTDAAIKAKGSGYTCQQKCDSGYSVSGCSNTSYCMKKCQSVTVLVDSVWYGTWDWVRFGTIASNPNCDAPQACGSCASGEIKERDEGNCTYKICINGYWSQKDGLPNGESCTKTNDDTENPCYKNESSNECHEYCDNNPTAQGCNNNSSTVETELCGNIKHGECNTQRTQKCLKEGEVWSMRNVSLSECSIIPESCNSGKTDCTSTVSKTDSGEAPYCSYSSDNAAIKYYYHEGAIVGGKECGLTTKGQWGEVGEDTPNCTITPNYDSEMTQQPITKKWKYDLVSCTYHCDSGVGKQKNNTTITDTKCFSLFGISKVKFANEDTDIALYNGKEVGVVGVEIDAFDGATENKITNYLKFLIDNDPSSNYSITTYVENEVTTILDGYPQTCSSYLSKNSSSGDYNTAKASCDALGGEWKGEQTDTVCSDSKGKDVRLEKYCCNLDNDSKICTGGIVSTTKNINNKNYTLNKLNLISKVSAQEAVTTSENFALYLPEYGIYSFQLGEYTYEKKNNTSDNVYIFYIESNGEKGLQIPEDTANPTSEEDIVLSASAYQISYTQESTAKQYELEEGINIISFNFVPTSTDSGAYMASDVISQANKNGVGIKYISAFDGGRWYEAYSCTSDTCTGTDFSIVPGRGYLISANNSGTMTIPGYDLKSSIPIPFSSGWNLVGIHGYTTAYTARTLIDSINKIEGLTANNVSWWPTSKGKYEGLQVENSTEYGLDFAISPTNGYFVRISEYSPSDTKCKSILWNDGGTLNGTCGNSK